MTIHDRFAHQPHSAETARDAITKTGHALIVLAPALGKTRTSALVWHGYYEGTGLYLVHSREILQHAIEEYGEVFGPESKRTLFTGSMREIEGSDVVFSTVQMMHLHCKKFRRDYFKWITVDETHHAQARTWRTAINHFTGCPKLGITATPDRMDMRDIRDMFGQEVVNIRIEEAAARGWFPIVDYHVLTDHGLDEKALHDLTKHMLEEGQRLTIAQINRRIFVRTRDEEAARIIELYDRPTVIFCRTIMHANHFRTFLTSAECYHSGQNADKNNETLARLRLGKTRRLLVVDAFNEGVDIPALGLVVFYRSTESQRIFLQQLGRGLRAAEDKDTLIVLDFVANVHRVVLLNEFKNRIIKIHEQVTTRKERDEEQFIYDPLHLTGIGFDFTFTEHAVDVMELLRRTTVEFYPTWQEASEAVIRLGISSEREYGKRYREDPRLPSNPHRYYNEFPGWKIYLGTALYSTLQETKEAALRLGIKNYTDYENRRHEDPRLPSNPHQYYTGEWSNWYDFLNNTRSVAHYSTLQEASAAVQALGIRDQITYKRRYTEDPRLPSNPNVTYKADWRGFPIFFGTRREPLYATCEEASKIAQKLGIKNGAEYSLRYKEDHRLPSNPRQTYRGSFQGWARFLGK